MFWICYCFILISNWKLFVLLRSWGGKIQHSTKRVWCSGLAKDAASEDQRGGKEMMLHWVRSFGSACVFPSGLLESAVNAVF